MDTWRLNGGDTILGHDPVTGKTWLRSREALREAVETQQLSPRLATKIEKTYSFEPEKQSSADEAQYEWLKRALQTNSALQSDWKFVMGHFPIHSASKYEHGDTASLVKRLDGILRDNNVDAYFSGHDHILQLSHREGSLHYYGSGAGAKRHPNVNQLYRGLKGSASGNFGFMKHKATKSSLTTTFVVSEGKNSENEKKYTFTYVQEKSTTNNNNNKEDVISAVESR